jgi:hypothetical protein
MSDTVWLALLHCELLRHSIEVEEVATTTLVAYCVTVLERVGRD